MCIYESHCLARFLIRRLGEHSLVSIVDKRPAVASVRGAKGLWFIGPGLQLGSEVGPVRWQ